jgi:hypothetical protein
MTLGRTPMLTVVSLLLGSAAVAARLTYDDYWNEASHKPGATTKEYPHAIVITDEKNFTVYIFTKPNSPAHPGVIVRKLLNGRNRAYFHTEGHSDGPDSAQPAFKAWMANPFR